MVSLKPHCPGYGCGFWALALHALFANRTLSFVAGMLLHPFVLVLTPAYRWNLFSSALQVPSRRCMRSSKPRLQHTFHSSSANLPRSVAPKVLRWRLAYCHLHNDDRATCDIDCACVAVTYAPYGTYPPSTCIHQGPLSTVGQPDRGPSSMGSAMLTPQLRTGYPQRRGGTLWRFATMSAQV